MTTRCFTKHSYYKEKFDADHFQGLKGYRTPLSVVKSSRLPANIAAYFVSIGWLLFFAFLHGWRFLSKISLDWPLTLTTQPSTSKLSDHPDILYKIQMDALLKWARSVGSIHAFLYHFYKLTIHKMDVPLRSRPHIQILLKMDTFFLRFYKIYTMQKICVRHKMLQQWKCGSISY